MADESQTPFDQGLYLVHLNRGREHFEQRNFTDAIQELGQARRLRPTDETVLNLLGLAYFKQEKYREADKVYNQLIEFNPESDILYFNQGLVCFKLGALDRAEASFLRALEIAPENPKVNFYLGHIYERKKQYYNAIFQYRKAGANIMVQRVQEKIEVARTAAKKLEQKKPTTETGDTLPPYEGTVAEPKSTDDTSPGSLKVTVDTIDRSRFLTALKQAPLPAKKEESKEKSALVFEDKVDKASTSREEVPTKPMERSAALFDDADTDEQPTEPLHMPFKESPPPESTPGSPVDVDSRAPLPPESTPGSPVDVDSRAPLPPESTPGSPVDVDSRAPLPPESTPGSPVDVDSRAPAGEPEEQTVEDDQRDEEADDDTVERLAEHPEGRTTKIEAKESEPADDITPEATAPVVAPMKVSEQTDSEPADERDTEPIGERFDEVSRAPAAEPSEPNQEGRTVVELTEPVIPDLSLTELSRGKQPTGAQDDLFASSPPPAEQRRRGSDSREMFPLGVPAERETGRSETVSIRRRISFDEEDDHRETTQRRGRMRRRDDIFRYLENNLMEVNFSGKVFIKQGTIYSYSGNLTFWVKPQREGATNPLVIVSGTGRLLLSDHQREITVMQINGEEIFIEPSHLLACQETLMPRYALIRKEGSSKSEIQVLAIQGTGMIALSVATDPLLLTVTEGFPVNVSSANIISWSGDLTPSIVDDEALADLMYPHSRPAVNLRLEGSGKVMMEKLSG